MKFTVVIDEEREEELLLYLHGHSELENRIKQLLRQEKLPLVGYRDKEIVKLSLNDVTCFTVESGKTFAVSDGERLRVDYRVYELEGMLGEEFVKINQSCIANITKIDRFDASLSGSLVVIFKDGTRDYVSRRRLKTVKERIGFKL